MPPACARIHQLSEALSNQIAAGEVIERPAAVVKELCENSLDAGATQLRVRSEDGGRRLVQVEDDGGGIAEEDLPLALARHATSKIASAEDLFKIATLGFRGEALPSITAVSELSISSRPRSADHGRRLSMRGSAIEADEPCALGTGTVVSVRNLFWNVPARLKFLKSEASETGHITEQVIRLALGHPGVGFHLVCDGRTVIEVPPAQVLPDRVRALFGSAFAASLIAVAHHMEAAQVAGFVAHPREAKPTAKRQYTFLNGRWVRDKLLLAAVREGFKGHLEPRLHGAVILHLDCDPGLVDVNVHPTKSEVRFRREGEVFALVSRAVAEGLTGHSGEFSLLTPQDAARVAALPTSPDAPESPRTGSAILSRTRVREPAMGIQERYLPHLPAVEAPAERAPGLPAEQPAADAGASATAAMHAQAPGSPAPGGALPPSPSGPLPTPAGADAAAAERAAPANASPAVLAGGPLTLPKGVRRVVQLNHMFLLIETDSGIRLVDQHALHEKALFLALDAACGELRSQGSQQLMVPRTVDLSASEVAAVEPLLATLAEVGIEAEAFGPTTVLVRAAPPRLKRLNWAGFFAALAETGSKDRAVGLIRERIRHSAACHGAVKAGQELSSQEQLELVSALYALEGMEHCPHGRPTTLDLPWAELARRFQRS